MIKTCTLKADLHSLKYFSTFSNSVVKILNYLMLFKILLSCIVYNFEIILIFVLNRNKKDLTFNKTLNLKMRTLTSIFKTNKEKAAVLKALKDIPLMESCLVYLKK